MNVSSIVKNQLVDWKISNQDGIVIGVSGGVDSMVLLHALHSKSQNICAVHINYHLRGKDSDLDQEFVTEYCKNHQIELKIFDADPETLQSNLQEKARDFRYQKFNEVLKQLHFKWIATAHHANDSTETFLINFSRGTGLKGLSGIKGLRNNIIRPLINVWRTNILEYAKEQNLNWREDQSNASTKYLRNKLRHEVLPVLENLEPRSKKGMQKSMKNLENDYALLLEIIHVLIANWTYKENGLIYLDLMQWKKYKNRKTLLYHFLEPYGHFNTSQICQAINTQPGKKFSAAYYTLWMDRDQLIIQENTKKAEDNPLVIQENTEEIESPNICFSVLEQEDFKRAKFADSFAWLDYSKLTFPLTLRKWQHGDKFQPLGMKGKKKISDYLIDKKIPLPIKENTLVLESAGEIIWLVGHRIDERYKVETNSKIIYLAKLL